MKLVIFKRIDGMFRQHVVGNPAMTYLLRGRINMIGRYERCPNCMQTIGTDEAVCHSCGFDIANYVEKPNCLKPFTVLENKYMIGRVIGMGGFGITYIGWDLNLQTYIAIKEYFPESLANRDTETNPEKTIVEPKGATVEMYNKGLKRYVEEAQNISRFYNLKGIVSVKDFFYANDTAYIVMEYINGINLKDFLKNSGGRLDEATVLNLMKPVFESLYRIHQSGLIHRDISPDNIMVDTNGEIKLIDFGSARGQAHEEEKTYTVILKHGYAPSEQYYAKGNQGPWTDIYSLCATMYKMLTGQIPPNSVERMEDDEYRSPSQLGIPVSPRTEAVLAKGLAVKVADRYQNIGQLLADLYGDAPMNVVPGMPTASSPTYANPTSLSQQSMHLSMQPQAAPVTGQADVAKKNGKLIAICAGAAVLVLIVVLLIVFVGGGKKKEKDPDEDNTTTENVASGSDATTEKPKKTTEEPDTTEEIVAPTSGYQYEWPTEISDDWHDYTIGVNGVVYKLPIPYSEWKSKGWNSEYLPTSLSGQGSDYVTFYNGSLECWAIVYNFQLNQADIEDCFIMAVEFEDIPSDAVIELAGGITVGVSSEDDIRTVFGAPDYFSDGYDDGSCYYDYAGDTYEDGMDLRVDANGILYDVRIGNSAMPEGLVVDTSVVTTDIPELNTKYVAPSGPSQGRTDNIFTIDGAYYKLPVPVSEFLKNGWSLDTATDDIIGGKSSIYTSLQKNGSKIDVTIENFESDSIIPANGIITCIEADPDYCKLEYVIPGGLTLDSTDEDITAAYSDLGEDYERDDSFTYNIYHDAYYDDDAGHSTAFSATVDVDDMTIYEMGCMVYIYDIKDVYP